MWSVPGVNKRGGKKKFLQVAARQPRSGCGAGVCAWQEGSTLEFGERRYRALPIVCVPPKYGKGSGEQCSGVG